MTDPTDAEATRYVGVADGAAAMIVAARAWAEGKFDEQLVAVEIPQRKGDPVVFAQDEGFRVAQSPLSPLEPGRMG